MIGPGARATTPDLDGWDARIAARLVARACLDAEAATDAMDRWAGTAPHRFALVGQMQQGWDDAGALAGTPAGFTLRAAVHNRLLLRSPRRFTPKHLLKAAALSALVLGSAATWQWARPAQVRTERFVAAASAPRMLRLADGSAVMLDRDAAIKVSFDESSRTVVLERGQARFLVSHDTRRPFKVHSGDYEVRATGTDFNVDAQPGRFAASLIRGGVVVSHVSTERNWYGIGRHTVATPIAPLAPGRQFIDEAGRDLVVRPFQPGDITAWQRGQVVFDHQPLVAAAATLSRHAAMRLVIRGEALRRAPISGTFPVGDAGNFADTVRLLFPGTRVTTHGAVITLSGPPQPHA